MAAGGSPAASRAELVAAQAALTAALQDANIAGLFGAPVDPAACPDYLEVVRHPMDLGTVLQGVEKSLQGAGPYLTAADIYRDVELVWSNCLKYNCRPVDKPMAMVCKRCSALVAKEWRKAGLEPPAKGSPGAAAAVRQPAGADGGAKPDATQPGTHRMSAHARPARDQRRPPNHAITTLKRLASVPCCRGAGPAPAAACRV
jgi:hypothetical protein